MTGSFRPPHPASDLDASGFRRLRSRFLADTILYAVTRAITAAAALLLLIVLARALAPEDLGLFSLVVNAAALAAIAWYGWLGSAAYRFSPAYRSAGRLSEMRALAVKIYAVLAVGLMVLVYLARVAGLNEVEGLSPGVFAAALVLIVSLGPAQALTELYRADGARTNFIAGTLLLGLGPLAAVLVAAWAIDVTVAVVLWSQAAVAASIALFIALSWIGGRRSSPADIRKALRRFFSYGFPYVGALVASWVLSVADRYLIASLHGTHDVGTYTAGYQLATAPFGFLFAAAVGAVEPLSYSAHEGGDESRAGRILGKTFALFLIAATLLLLLLSIAREEIAIRLLGATYAASAEVIPLAALGSVLLSLALIRQQVMMLMRRPQRAFANLAAAAVLNICLNLILIPQLGNLGAAVASAGAYAVLLVIVVVTTRHRYSFSLPRDWMKAWAIASLACSVALGAMRVLMGDSTIQVAILLVLTTVVYVSVLLLVSGGSILDFIKNLGSSDGDGARVG